MVDLRLLNSLLWGRVKDIYYFESPLKLDETHGQLLAERVQYALRTARGNRRCRIPRNPRPAKSSTKYAILL